MHSSLSRFAVAIAFVALSGCSTQHSPLAPESRAAAHGGGVSSAAPAVQYRVETLDLPASLGAFTSAFGINDAGTVVGNFGAPDETVHGFIEQNGVFTDIIVPGAASFDRGGLGAINDQGLAVGSYTDASEVGHMYLRDRGGNVTFLPDAIPGALSNDATGINLLGTIAGTVFDSDGNAHGFVFAGGVSTTYDHAGAVRTRLLGINDKGDVVGFWVDAGGVRHGLLISGGVEKEILVPGATGVGCSGINNQGQIVGFYSSAGVTHGFLLDHGTITTIDFPGSADTRLTKINNLGVIVGTYDFFSRGMIATPSRGPAS